MIWATRRQLSALVVNCCPVNCLPAKTSQTRNSVLSRPSPSRVTAPTLYNLVGNKEQVLFAAVEEQTLGFVAALERSGPDLMAVVGMLLIAVAGISAVRQKRIG